MPFIFRDISLIIKTSAYYKGIGYIALEPTLTISIYRVSKACTLHRLKGFPKVIFRSFVPSDPNNLHDGRERPCNAVNFRMEKHVLCYCYEFMTWA